MTILSSLGPRHPAFCRSILRTGLGRDLVFPWYGWVEDELLESVDGSVKFTRTGSIPSNKYGLYKGQILRGWIGNGSTYYTGPNLDVGQGVSFTMSVTFEATSSFNWQALAGSQSENAELDVVNSYSGGKWAFFDGGSYAGMSVVSGIGICNLTIVQRRDTVNNIPIYYCYKDGILEAQYNGTGSNVFSIPSYLGYAGYGPGIFNYGTIYTGHFWKRPLTSSEVYSHVHDLYGSLDRRILVPVRTGITAGSTNVGNANGTSTVAGIGSSIAISIGNADGLSTISGIGSSLSKAVGNADGSTTVSGVGLSLFRVVGNADGLSTANAVGSALTGNIGTANGISTATGIGASFFVGIGNADGVSTANAVGQAISGNVGNAAGIATAGAIGASIFASVGNALGVSTANAVGYASGGTVLPVLITKISPFTALDTISAIGYQMYRYVSNVLTTDHGHTTTDISSIPSVTNGYSVGLTSNNITLDSDYGYRGIIVWDSGGGSPIYRADEVFIPTQDIDMGQGVPTTNTSQTVGDSLNAARAQGFGKWTLSGTTLILYAPDGSTPVRTFTLDSATIPTSRT